MRMKPWMWIAMTLLVAVASVGCKRAPDEVDERPMVVATTTMLEDMTRHLAGDDVKVSGLLSPGADPHLYQPRPGDARQIAASDMVVMNGLLLEGWMEGLVRHAGGERPVIVVGDAIPRERLMEVDGAVDPHIWFDVSLWREGAQHVSKALQQLFDEGDARRNAIAERHAHYDKTLAELDEWTRAQLATVPQGQRVLITSHDAFGYFGRAYNLDVEAIQGLSTEQEASQRDVINMVELVRKRNAPAVFIESSVSPGLIEQVARESGVRVSGPLYSDSLGTVESGVNTYIKMVETNVQLITGQLGGSPQAFESSVVPDAPESAGETDV
ncbi:manganese transporter [Lujinxingia litoralis]|uniref:Manganese transporter n=1 Tax=Lujinxingia litoralis TaxID=2211119 RepID=A0A328C897_9DELT|nr:metal ABC transporter substrate-binding protein [Lujinxingia litoralis]RAL23566.1 manganese transporter [Lujinxingia litoralis]